MSDLILRAADLLAHAQRAIALTGAGIGTPSGIPDFRSPEIGLWANYNPMEIATIYVFRRQPEEFFNWIRPLAHQMIEAQPNAAHRALAELQRAGRLTTIITQNIDGLHQRAGATDVIELHGSIFTATCVRCYHVFASDRFIHALIEQGQVPTCPDCGSILKPNVILFGEALPALAITAAKRAVHHCDLMIVIGSSLEVAPASDLPLMALARQAKLIIVNRDPTHIDQHADVVIRDDLAIAVPKMAARCLPGYIGE
jgi:NAD-dependent deacetylase